MLVIFGEAAFKQEEYTVAKLNSLMPRGALKTASVICDLPRYIGA